MMKLPSHAVGAFRRSPLFTISLLSAAFLVLPPWLARGGQHPAEPCATRSDFAWLQLAGPMQANSYAALGAMFEERNQFSCAAQAFAHAAALDPSSAKLAYELGTSLYAARRMTEAEQALSRSVALDPAKPEAHLALGVVDHDMGKSSDALRQWETALRIDPASVTTIDWIAKARIEAGQYTTAAELLRSAPADEELTLDLMLADTKSGLFDEAIDRGGKALEAHPEWRRVYLALSTVFVQRNRLEDAAAILRKGRAKHPGDQSMTVAYLRVLVLKGDTAEARTLAGEVLKQRPRDYDALYLSGLIEREDANYDAARQSLEAAAALRPGQYDVEYNLGLVLAKLQQSKEAEAHLRKAIELDSSGAEAHFQLAAVLRSIGDAEAAQQQLATYRKLMKDREIRDEGITLTNRAAQKLQEGDAATAVSLYKDAIGDLPGDAQAFYRLAMALDKTGAWQEEKTALEQALHLQPGFAAAQNQLGYVAVQTGDTAQAEVHFRQAIASATQFAEAESNLGSLLASENRNSEAELHFQAALAANPRFTDAWINLAATLASTARFDEARKAAANALQIEPANVDAASLLRSLPNSQ